MDVSAGIEHAVAGLEPGGHLVGMRALTGGVSADVFGLDIATSDRGRRRVVIRRHRADDLEQHRSTVIAKEYRLLAALHRLGFAVPEPYLYVDTDAMTAPYLVMDWVDGSTELAGDGLAGALDEMALFLVKLHALDPFSLQISELEPIEDPLVAISTYLPPTEVGREVAARLASGDIEQGLSGSPTAQMIQWARFRRSPTSTMQTYGGSWPTPSAPERWRASVTEELLDDRREVPAFSDRHSGLDRFG